MIPEPTIYIDQNGDECIEEDDYRYWKCLKCGAKYPYSSMTFYKGRLVHKLTCQCGQEATGDKEIWQKFDWIEETEDDEDE